MSELRSLPTFGEALLVLIAGLVINASGETWLIWFYRIWTALWLFTFVYGAARHYFRKEPTR